MAITEVANYSFFAADGANINLSFFGQAAENDIVLVMGGHARTGSNAGVSTSGYTELFDTTSTVRFSASWKRMGATPDTSVDCIGSGNSNDAVVYGYIIFRGVSQVTAIDATSTTTSGTGQPNSPSITTVTNGSVVVSAFLQNARAFTYTEPSGYTLTYTNEWDDTNDAAISAAWKTITTAGAENPAPWSLGATGSFQAASIALRVDSGTVSDAVVSATGTGTATFIDGSITTAPAVFAATGTGTLAFVAAVTQESVAAMTGTGTASLVGGSIADAVGAMTGTGTASFVNNSQSVGGGALEATGTGTATFTASPFDSRPFSMTGTNATDFVGVTVASQGPFTMTGTGTALFVGTLQGQGNLSADALVTVTFTGGAISSRAPSMTGTGTVNFVGARDRLSHIRETIESRGTVSVSIN
jgi:hypothetical protein